MCPTHVHLLLKIDSQHHLEPYKASAQEKTNPQTLFVPTNRCINIPESRPVHVSFLFSEKLIQNTIFYIFFRHNFVYSNKNYRHFNVYIFDLNKQKMIHDQG
jgi:hypothetical protein